MMSKFLVLFAGLAVSCGGAIVEDEPQPSGNGGSGGVSTDIEDTNDDNPFTPDDEGDTLVDGGNVGGDSGGPDSPNPDRPPVSAACADDCAALDARERCPGETDFEVRDCERLCAGRDTEGEECAPELGDVFSCMAARPEVFMCNGAGDEVIRCGVCDDEFQALANCGLEVGCFWAD